jgi:hypothetical protein
MSEEKQPEKLTTVGDIFIRNDIAVILAALADDLPNLTEVIVITRDRNNKVDMHESTNDVLRHIGLLEIAKMMLVSDVTNFEGDENG